MVLKQMAHALLRAFRGVPAINGMIRTGGRSPPIKRPPIRSMWSSQLSQPLNPGKPQDCTGPLTGAMKPIFAVADTPAVSRGSARFIAGLWAKLP